jgi:putative NIF3 family GTP cyclohydrolase 1 type 2
VHETPERTLGELARRIADKTRELGQPAVQVVGNLDEPVSRVGLGTGAITDVKAMIEMGADVVVTTDDGISYWSAGSLTQDWGVPMIVCNHAVAEEWGIRNLAAYMQKSFSETPVMHIPQGCPFILI